MTPAELKSARHALGLSVEGFAQLMRVEGRSVRRWEDGTRDIPGPAEAHLELLLAVPAARKHYGLTLTQPQPT